VKPSLPSSWRWIPMGSVLERRRDLINPATMSNRTFRSVGLEDIVGEGVGEVIVQTLDGSELASTKAVFSEGELLYGRLRPYLNKAAIAPCDGVCSTEIWVFRAKPQIDLLYAFLCVISPLVLERVSRITQGANLPRVEADAFDRLDIPIPPLSEQRQIVAMLGEVRGVRRLRRQVDGLTADLIPAIFHEMFGDPLSNDRDWPTEVLPNLGVLDRGRSRHRPRDEPSLYGGPYPFIQTGDVKNSNGWITRFAQTYSEKGLAQSRLWPAGTMCITIAANIAATAIMTFDACFPDSVVGFTPTDSVTVEYVRWTFEVLKAKMEAQAHEGAQKNINLKILNALRLAVPPKALQEEFRKRVHAIRDISVLSLGNGSTNPQAKMIDPIDALTSSLLAHAFSGELTAEWRESNHELLEREAHQRDAALKAAGVTFAKPTRPKVTTDLPTTGRHAELNRAQRALLHQAAHAAAANDAGPAFTITSMRDWLESPLDDLPDDALRRHLEVLVARGLMKLVSRPTGDSSSSVDARSCFGNVYRLVRETVDEDEAPDVARMEELRRLAAWDADHSEGN
jgi:type I restriction enzyme, S subunit